MKLSALLLLLLSACAASPVSTSSTSNSEVAVALLFEHDGCKVYRFSDAGNFHYYARCPEGAQAMTTRKESCGKNCWRTVHENTQTLEGQR